MSHTDKIKGTELRVRPLDEVGNPLPGASWQSLTTGSFTMEFTQEDVDPELTKLLFNLDDDMKPIEPVLTEKDVEQAKGVLRQVDELIEEYGYRKLLLWICSGYNPSQIEKLGVLDDVADA
jgi:hypothetical protein